jgi:hypothetical protein
VDDIEGQCANDDDDWMFQTFEKKKNHQAANSMQPQSKHAAYKFDDHEDFIIPDEDIDNVVESNKHSNN